MILFNNIVEVFVLPNFNLISFGNVFIQRVEDSFIAATLVNIILSGLPLFLIALLKKAWAATLSLLALKPLRTKAAVSAVTWIAR